MTQLELQETQKELTKLKHTHNKALHDLTETKHDLNGTKDKLAEVTLESNQANDQLNTAHRDLVALENSASADKEQALYSTRSQAIQVCKASGARLLLAWPGKAASYRGLKAALGIWITQCSWAHLVIGLKEEIYTLSRQLGDDFVRH